MFFAVVQAYYGVQVAERNLEVMKDAVTAAEEDLRRARALFDSGLATEADVLSIQVRRAKLEDQRIVAHNLVEVQRAELNDRLGEPLDRKLHSAHALDAGRARKGS